MSESVSNWGKWGPKDQRGTINYITPEKTLEAAQLVKQGKVYNLAIPLSHNGPIWPGRHANWHVATYHNLCGDGPGGSEDIIMIHTHGSTHVDALCHVFRDGKMYNGFDANDAINQTGTKKNGIENIRGIVTRGVMLDFCAHEGVDYLPPDRIITPDDIEAVSSAQGVSIGSGDAVLFRTGWLKVHDEDKEKFDAMQPGPSAAVAEWAYENEIAVLAADNSAVEHVPHPDGMPIHQSFLRDQGGYLMELLNLDELAADSVYEFQFVVAPLNIKRGMGSPISPLAIC
jgi:kynurenine formamidase